MGELSLALPYLENQWVHLTRTKLLSPRVAVLGPQACSTCGTMQVMVGGLCADAVLPPRGGGHKDQRP